MHNDENPQLLPGETFGQWVRRIRTSKRLRVVDCSREAGIEHPRRSRLTERAVVYVFLVVTGFQFYTKERSRVIRCNTRASEFAMRLFWHDKRPFLVCVV